MAPYKFMKAIKEEKEFEKFGLTEASDNAIIAYTIKMKEVDKDDRKAYCKKAVSSDGQTVSCFIKFYRGKMFDPWGIYHGRERRLDLEYRKVSEKAFDMFSSYLKTRNYRHFLQSEREAL